jgi:hypothetical protein
MGTFFGRTLIAVCWLFTSCIGGAALLAMRDGKLLNVPVWLIVVYAVAAIVARPMRAIEDKP